MIYNRRSSSDTEVTGAMRIGVMIGSAAQERVVPAQLVANARAAEAAGFASAWVSHIPWSLDALTALTLAAGATERIELGTAVVPTYPRHPLSLAQAALSVQAASGGRVTLGIGPSHPYVIETMYGLTWDRPAHHTAEYVQALRACFATGPDDNIVSVDDDADRARTRAAELFSAYEGVPTYQRVFERNQSPWPVDAAVIGDERTVADRIRRFGDLGATDFLATVLGLGDDPGASRDRTFALLASLL
jgi:alkanesulfonate monooxygenase SsuD/methylene tetrahydromethanopterin reductase-like flavin-dependent oxidoreductase (luciferase family)